MEKKSGIYRHCHHNKLFEYVYDEQERINYIINRKPANEVDTRLRLFKPEKMENLPKEVKEAYKAHNKARKAREEAYKACEEAREAREEALEAYEEANKAYGAMYKVLKEAIVNNMDKLEELHRKECPDCPWDGKTIFPKKEKV